MSDTIKERLVRFIDEVWSAGNVEAADAYLAPRYTLHHDPGDAWDGQTLDLDGYKERVRISRAPRAAWSRRGAGRAPTKATSPASPPRASQSPCRE